MHRPSARFAARLRALGPDRVDALIATAFGLEMQVESWLLLDEPVGERAAASLLSLAVTAALAARRRRPLGAVALGFGALAATSQIGGGEQPGLIGPVFASAFIAYGAGLVLTGRRLVVAIAVALAGAVATLALDSYATGVASLFSTLLLEVAGPVLIARAMRDRARLGVALEANRRRAEAERGERAAQAVLDERARIAGELHDVVGHALSAMVIQAAGARRLIGRDPAAAAGAFAAVEETGRDALTEIRGVLGVLRREDEALALAPQPSLAHLNDLVARTERGGLPVELRVEGDSRPLPAGVDLTAFRLLQEALAQARDAGGAGRAEILVRYGADRVELVVRDDGAPPRPPLLARERVGLYGGELAAGTGRSGGHVVRVRLPTASAA